MPCVLSENPLGMGSRQNAGRCKKSKINKMQEHPNGSAGLGYTKATLGNAIPRKRHRSCNASNKLLSCQATDGCKAQAKSSNTSDRLPQAQDLQTLCLTAFKRLCTTRNTMPGQIGRGLHSIFVLLEGITKLASSWHSRLPTVPRQVLSTNFRV